MEILIRKMPSECEPRRGFLSKSERFDSRLISSQNNNSVLLRMTRDSSRSDNFSPAQTSPLCQSCSKERACDENILLPDNK